jgi:hypothetical protein
MTRDEFIEKLAQELFQEQNTVNSWDKVPEWLREHYRNKAKEVYLPIFSKYVGEFVNPFPLSYDWVVSRKAVEQFRSAIQEDLKDA